ncbi:dihydroorotate dehydrogenase electron transfer subunit [Paraburkholderia phytofirmans]|jgi:dihydroorotate dehydrogenase electron transfer subunit|uniref:dihydroorotate dehydrogenase electron transfer subunit n=1 Tax=Paraburkholderia sp. BL9I2N2 TaxID=1938809 RepID=UPI00104A9C49|nr:dihydroorotate dehydrogenase electron transfer subunit [Paraburkholderia sp. BL9I2N2]TCK95709.1 dihydroorotate oxidase B electron transfer subunit [Paraburkholderia sp. BL9I2N2]
MSASPCGVENAAIVASYRCRVAEHYWVNQRYKYIRLEADAPIARITKAGQFYQLKCPTTLEHEPFLLRPMSVYGAGPEDNRIEFLYNVTGVGTKAMATLLEGGRMDIVGPLGNTFTFSANYRRILVVARGVGLATMAPLIKEASQAGVDITAVMSARSPADLMEKEFLRGATADVRSVFDADGTSSVEAMEVLLRELIEQQRPDAIYTCGSHRLLMLLQRVLSDYPRITAEVAMEQRMACGMGVCLSCVRLFDCDGDRKFLRVCREGPVFPIREVVGEVEFG